MVRLAAKILPTSNTAGRPTTTCAGASRVHHGYPTPYICGRASSTTPGESRRRRDGATPGRARPGRPPVLHPVEHSLVKPHADRPGHDAEQRRPAGSSPVVGARSPGPAGKERRPTERGAADDVSRSRRPELAATTASNVRTRAGSSSKAKNTPASGALKVAAMPPAAPQATSSRSGLGPRTSCPSGRARAEPICTIGPSRPTEPPPPMVSAEASALTTPPAADPPAVLRHGQHHLRHPVAAGLAGEAVHQRSVEQAGDHGHDEYEEDAQKRQMQAGCVPLLAELCVAGGRPGW